MPQAHNENPPKNPAHSDVEIDQRHLTVHINKSNVYELVFHT